MWLQPGENRQQALPVSGTDRISVTCIHQTSVFWLHYRSKFPSVISVLRILIAPQGPETGSPLFKGLNATCSGHVGL